MIGEEKTQSGKYTDVKKSISIGKKKLDIFYKNLLDSSSLFLHSMIKCGCNVANNFRLKKGNGD